MSDVNILFPKSISTVELFAVFIFLLISYSLLGSTLKVFPDASLKALKFIVLVETLTILTIPVPATFSSFLKSISTSSPTLILDLSISLVNKTKLFPLILLTWNLDDVL